MPDHRGGPVMMDAHEMIDEHVERLIVRALDGEATAAERAELDALMAQNPAVRALHDEYERLDGAAKTALERVLVRPTPATPAPRIYRGPWLVAAAGVLAAAAAIGLMTS